MKKINKIIFLYSAYVVLFANKVHAQGIVNCDGVIGANPCDFNDFMTLLNAIASFIIFRLPLLLFVFVLAYGGFNMMFADRSKSDAWKKIKSNLVNLVLGYLLVLGAYLIVKTFVTLLAGDNLTFKTFFN